MRKFDEVNNEMNEIPEITDTPDAGKPAGSGLRGFFQMVYKLRSLLLSIPVAVAAVILAVRNFAMLPAQVGIDMQPNGEFLYLMDKSIAVLVPLAVTAVCLLLTFFSKRMMYPWLISVFSLLLPLVILLINTFPG